MKRKLTLAALLVATLLWVAGAVAQSATSEQGHAPAAQQPAPESQTPGQGAKGRDAAEKAAEQGGVSAQLAEASREAAAEGEENAEFKESPSVRFVASITGLSLRGAYWLSIALNFAILAVLIILVSKSKLPAMFRTRTGEIQRGISEARKASENANRRLADIEARLARMDQEVAGMRELAEKEAALEEQRIAAATQEETRKIVEAAEAEISAAGKMARRELKAFAAELATALAEKRIHIDAATDKALVSNFVEQLNHPGSSKEAK